MVVIVDYGLGNLASIRNMLRKVGAEAVVSSDPRDIEAAERLVLPGVGAFDEGMRNLRARDLEKPLRRKVLEQGTPILGICLGMQIMTEGSEEGQESGLGWIPGRCRRFRFEGEPRPKVPHMGWNAVHLRRDEPLFRGYEGEIAFYFVHSYHVVCERPDDVTAVARHGYEFTAAFGRANLLGVQFHPEKSHRFGKRLLGNFAGLPPC